MQSRATHLLSVEIRKWPRTGLAGALALACLVGGADAAERPAEVSSKAVHSYLGVVATGSPEATEAAVAVLERGGNAIDAAVTASLVLGVADSDASGIGGATYMVLRMADGHASVIDGTPRAPVAIDLPAFDRLKAQKVKYGIGFIAVPTTLAVLQLALDRYGTLTMAEALQPAMEVAEHGYRLSRIQIIWTQDYYADIMAASSYMPFLAMEDGETIGTEGDLICRPELARTLRRIAREGTSAFYRGSIADEIEADMIRKGGFLRKSDFAALRIRETRPLVDTYRGRQILTVPAPAGGPTLLAELNILESYPSRFLAEDSVERLGVLVEAVRIARSGYAASVAGGGVSAMFAADHLSKELGARRARMIVPGSMIPESDLAPEIDPDCLPSSESTTQISIIDQWGNTVSVTQSLAHSFGAKIATPGLGFPYNNFLYGFNASDPKCPGFLRARAPCGNDMAPLILVDEGRSVTAFGSPGSSRIPSILSNVISNLVDRGMNAEDAINAPRIAWGGTDVKEVNIELVDPITEDDMAALGNAGYEHWRVVRFPGTSKMELSLGGVNLATHDFETGVFTGVIDGRRGGLALVPRAISETSKK